MSSLNLTNLLAGQVTGYSVANEQYNTENLKKINYVTAANGLFRVEKTPIAIFKSQVEKFEKLIPGLEVMEAGPELLIPKIPFKYLQMALSFYRDVNDKDKTEASLLFFWNSNNKVLPEKYSDGTDVKGLLEDGQLVIYVPRQRNSKTLSEFHMDPMVDWLRDNLTMLCESHSHNTMDAFFSGTDDANENSTQFYGVWGRVDKEQPMFAFRYCSGDSKTIIDPSVLFDWPMITTTKTYEVTSTVKDFVPQTFTDIENEIYKGPFEHLDYPEDWMGQHTPRAEFSFKSSGGKSYSASQHGKMDQLQWNMNYAPAFDVNETAYLPFSDALGMSDAEILKFMDAEDQKYKSDIYDNIQDIAAEYDSLGYSRIMESAMNAVGKNIK